MLLCLCLCSLLLDELVAIDLFLLRQLRCFDLLHILLACDIWDMENIFLIYSDSLILLHTLGLDRFNLFYFFVNLSWIDIHSSAETVGELFARFPIFEMGIDLSQEVSLELEGRDRFAIVLVKVLHEPLLFVLHIMFVFFPLVVVCFAVAEVINNLGHLVQGQCLTVVYIILCELGIQYGLEISSKLWQLNLAVAVLKVHGLHDLVKVVRMRQGRLGLPRYMALGWIREGLRERLNFILVQSTISVRVEDFENLLDSCFLSGSVD